MKKLSFAISACALLATAGAHADINFRGFGSIVGGQAIDVDEGSSTMGYTESWDFRRDSLMALQMDADLEDDLTATVQLMSRGSNNWEVDVEWAYLTYAFTDQLQLSAGRIRAPFYRYSDFLDVRYAYNWITAPERVYSFDFPGYDGFSLLYNSSMGPVDSSLQLVAGKMDSDTTGGTPILFEDFVGVSWVGTWEWLTARASYLQAEVTIPDGSVEGAADGYEYLGNLILDGGYIPVGGAPAEVPSIVDSFNGTASLVEAGNPGFASNLREYATAYSSVGNAHLAAVDSIRIEESDGSYIGLGLSVDREALIVDSEWIQYEAEDSLIQQTTAYYLTLGWRFGPTVVYGTYSREQMDAPLGVANSIPDISAVADAIEDDTDFASLGAAGASMQQLAVALEAQSAGAVASVAAGEVDVVNHQLGVRWDFHSSAAFKVSYEERDNQISDVQGSTLRVAIDMVF